MLVIGRGKPAPRSDEDQSHMACPHEDGGADHLDVPLPGAVSQEVMDRDQCEGDPEEDENPVAPESPHHSSAALAHLPHCAPIRNEGLTGAPPPPRVRASSPRGRSRSSGRSSPGGRTHGRTWRASCRSSCPQARTYGHPLLCAAEGDRPEAAPCTVEKATKRHGDKRSAAWSGPDACAPNVLRPPSLSRRTAVDKGGAKGSRTPDLWYANSARGFSVLPRNPLACAQPRGRVRARVPE